MSSELIRRHAALVEAAAARIFPTTSTPGATEAGAASYIRRLLAEAYPGLLPLYRSGCRALDRHAKRRFGKGFLGIAAAGQDEVLSDFEAGRVPGFSRASQFFETLLEHTMEGVLGEPAYGGNRGLVGWRARRPLRDGPRRHSHDRPLRGYPCQCVYRAERRLAHG